LRPLQPFAFPYNLDSKVVRDCEPYMSRCFNKIQIDPYNPYNPYNLLLYPTRARAIMILSKYIHAHARTRIESCPKGCKGCKGYKVFPVSVYNAITYIPYNLSNQISEGCKDSAKVVRVYQQQPKNRENASPRHFRRLKKTLRARW